MAHPIVTRCASSVAALALAAAAPAFAEYSVSAVKAYDYHHASVLGTALDLTVVAADKADADAADQAVMAEIARLQKILSAYDDTAELARLNASPVNGPAMHVSRELIDVLKLYDKWFKQTGGAYSGHAGSVIALWKQAEKDAQLPADAALAAAAQQSKAPAWEIDETAGTITRVSDQLIDLNSIGKGYIIDKAVAAATKTPTKLKGLLLNIGGDLRTWGTPAPEHGTFWAIGVQDPNHPELNAKPLTTVYVPGGKSVSSSGAYQRFYSIGGKQYSHIIDARTGQPGKNKAATVIANDSATANALATISCIVRFGQGFEMTRATPDAQTMIITTSNDVLRTDGFKDYENQSTAKELFGPKQPSQFPAGYKMTVDLKVMPSQRRPYVFAWVVDSAGKYVKTLAAFGNDSKYWQDMHEWWKFAAKNKVLRSSTHATQASGNYPLVWDGTNEQGSGVSLGEYSVWIEVSAEHGPYAVKVGKINVGTSPASTTIGASSAFEAVSIKYGPGAR